MSGLGTFTVHVLATDAGAWTVDLECDGQCWASGRARTSKADAVVDGQAFARASGLELVIDGDAHDASAALDDAAIGSERQVLDNPLYRGSERGGSNPVENRT